MKIRETVNGIEMITLIGDDKNKAVNAIIDMLTELSDNNKLSVERTARTNNVMFTDKESLISLTIKMNKTIMRIIVDDYINNRIFNFAVRVGENNSQALLDCIKKCKNAIKINEFKNTINSVLESNK
mgnify:CR=1 FL=1